MGVDHFLMTLNILGRPLGGVLHLLLFTLNFSFFLKPSYPPSARPGPKSILVMANDSPRADQSLETVTIFAK